MAQQTDTQLRGKLMYSVFVRNHTPEGTFQALERDLDRIAALGTDIIWLLPIHPIGEVSRNPRLPRREPRIRDARRPHASRRADS